MSFLSTDRLMLQALRSSKVRGVQLAIVVDNKDGEGNPGYRIKLKFPWLNEQEASFWARIAVPMGGPGRGTYVLPEIDDQVLVVFEHGDIGRPIVVGSLWSKQQEPVEINQSGKNNTKLIKSRSGHRVIFDDKEGAEKIVIVDSTKKNKIVLDSVNKTVKIECDGDIAITAKTSVILHANALKIGTSEAFAGKGAQLLAHAAKTLGMKAASGITVGGGNTTINVSNAAATSVSGSGAGELGAVAAEKPKDSIADKAASGGRGGGGGGGGGGAAPQAVPASAQPVADQAAAPGPDLGVENGIGLSLIDKNTGNALPHRPFKMSSPEDGIIQGKLDGGGKNVQVFLQASQMDVECPFLSGPETVHLVKQGEHTSGIAEKFGFEHYKAVWDAPANQQLATLRKHPHILLLDDQLVIPERKSTPQKLATGKEHVIAIDRSPLRLEVVLQDTFKRPVANANVSFNGASSTTDADGLFKTDLDKQAHSGTLSLPSKDLRLLVGHLDPIDTDSGWRSRLMNLGFLWDDDGGAEEDRIAIEDFQADQKIKVTGTMDSATRARLEKAHGC